jgi:hypothetical protein
MNFDEVEYSFLVASEVHLRDGLGFEVYRHVAEKESCLRYSATIANFSTLSRSSYRTFLYRSLSTLPRWRATSLADLWLKSAKSCL